MFRAVMNHHIKRFKRNPIVMTVMILYSLICLTDWYVSHYRVHPLFFDFAVEIIFYYLIAFYFVPAFFNPNNKVAEGDESFMTSPGYARQENASGCFSYDPSSSSERYNPNRYDVSSPLYESSLGKPL